MLFENSDFYWAIFWRLQCLKHKIGFASGASVSVSWYWPCCLDISEYKDTTKQSNVRLRCGGCFRHVAFCCPRASKCSRGSPIVLGAAVGVIFEFMPMFSTCMQIEIYIFLDIGYTVPCGSHVMILTLRKACRGTAIRSVLPCGAGII